MANPLPFQPIQEVPGAFVLDAPRFFDDRGFFQEYFHDGKYAEYLPKCKQTSISVSQKNVIRGMHCSPYGKLVQCLKGKIIDTIIDLREDSPTYLQKFSVELSGGKQIFCPAGCGHGFFACEDESLVLYGQESNFNAQGEMYVNPFDPTLGIAWPAVIGEGEYIMSNGDKNGPNLADARKAWKERNK